ncbi:MAG: chorismate mutase [Kiritimatiellae bacterium]|nr:chorismate mutase [Kiritimatiellia bacterium]
MSLENLRKTVDEIDADIVNLLNKRVSVAIEIGHEKKKTGASVTDSAREDEVVSRIHAMNEGAFDADALEYIYRKIIGACSAVQV